MEALAEKLKRILETALNDGRAELETLPNGHVCGQVIASEFDGKDYETRRKRIREVLDQAQTQRSLSAEDLSNISTLLTYTPDEWSVTLEEGA